MDQDSLFSGVLTPVITPFDSDLNPDPDMLAAHCRWLTSQNVDLAVFGTNSEGNSLSVREKKDLLTHLCASGISPGSLMPGTGCSALTDSVTLTGHAVELGCRGVLMLPPFYYKGVSEEGLFASFSEVVERVGSDQLRIYLYNIPPVAQVPLTVSLIDRLKKAYPDTIVGIKDSSGDWDNTQSLLDAGWDNFQVFVGSESFLLQNMRAGGAGCISATANVNPASIRELYDNWEESDADDRQASLNDIRNEFTRFPMIPALKAATAFFSGNSSWRRVRPPLVSLSSSDSSTLIANLADRSFAMPGL